MQTILDILKKTEAFFAQKGVPSPRIDAELLIAHVLNCKRLDLYLQFDKPLDNSALDQLRPLVKRRATREPLQYILGTAPFMDLTLAVTPATLIPRPETEELVHHLITVLKESPPESILDLGTGSGAIAIALAQAFPSSRVIAVDASSDALAIAQQNINTYQLQDRVNLIHSNWFESIPNQTFSLIVSNPPYLTDAELTTAQPEVQGHEPHSALTSPDDGIADIFHILDNAPKYLGDNALLALETGVHHHSKIAEKATQLGYLNVHSFKDASSRPRYVTLTIN